MAGGYLGLLVDQFSGLCSSVGLRPSEVVGEFMRRVLTVGDVEELASLAISKIDTLKMFVESLGLNPDEVLSKDALSIPHRTIVDTESHQIKVLNEALKNATLQELRNA